MSGVPVAEFTGLVEMMTGVCAASQGRILVTPRRPTTTPCERPSRRTARSTTGSSGERRHRAREGGREREREGEGGREREGGREEDGRPTRSRDADVRSVQN